MTVSGISDGVFDEADAFVHAATRAFANEVDCPPPPSSGSPWASRARDAGVLSLVLDAMRRSDHELGAEAGALRLRAIARHQRTLVDLGEAGATLDEAGVPWAVVKGPVLRSLVFAQPHCRDYADLDLLVPPSALRRAVDVLLAKGASLLPMDVAMGVADRTAELDLRLRHGTVLDLHWSLTNRGVVRDRFPISTDELLSYRKQRRVDGVDVFTLQDTDLVLHVLLHACLGGCAQLRWLVDAQQCVTWLDVPPRVLAWRARQLGLTGVARVVLARSAQFVDSTVGAWSEQMGEETPWTRLVERAGGRCPPSAPSAGTTSGAAYYASAAGTTRGSLTALARAGAASRQSRGRDRVGANPHPVDRADPALGAWLDLAERGGRG